MYKIIGADGREYGPISLDQLNEWIAEGRANGQTRAMPEGASDWQTIADLPECAAALTAAAAPAGQAPPPVGGVDAEALAAAIIARGYRVEIGSCFSRSWELLKSNFWPIVGATALVMLAQGAIGAIPFLGGVAGLLLGGVFNGGLYWFFLKQVRGDTVTVGDAFAGFSLAFVPLMLTGLITGLLTIVGLILCLVPGIYVAVAWVFAPALVIDKRLDFWPAMECSRKVVSKNWWSMFGLLLLGGLLGLAGLLACLIGIFVAAPIVIGAIVYAYEDIFGGVSQPS